MNSSSDSRIGRFLISAVVVIAALSGLGLVSEQVATFRPDRQLAQRKLVPTPSPLLATLVAPGDGTADREVGQPDFNHNAPNFVDAESLDIDNGVNSIAGVAVDQSSIPNHVFVADQLNNRVLGWSSVAALVNGKSATIVIGQPDFFASTANFNGVTASSLNNPTGVAVDSSGNLYVSDSSNHRVLEYNTPFLATGELGSGDNIADAVFGQSDNFTNNTATTGPNGLSFPTGLVLDSMGNLYIADTNNNRVLEYSSPSLSSVPSRVFGQGGSFVSNACNQNAGITQSTLCHPVGLGVDSAGDLYVADYSNSRGLEYSTPTTTDTVADKVFGQALFTTGSCNGPGVTATSLCMPRGVALDGSDRLYITDQNNSRVLEYDTPLTSNTANVVFGQFSMTTNACNHSSVVDATGLCRPSAGALDSVGDLFVTDSSNNRVLVYKTPLTTNTTADVVLGQPDAAHNAPNEPDASAFSVPSWVALDKSVNPPKLYVADSANNRVLGFNSATAFANGAAADVVIGQVDFFSVACETTSATSLCNPQGVAVDKHGNLYVADYNNSRVVEYDAPITSSKAAHLVFGQPTLLTSGCNSGAVAPGTGICHPLGLAVDSSDNVYLADNANSRVFKYTTPLTTDTVPDAVLGQASFTAKACNQGVALAATGLCNPNGVAVDASGNVYVGDYSNSRVLKFAAPITTNKAASLALGAASLVTGGCPGGATTSQSLCYPRGVAVDTLGRAYVSDTLRHRILEFNTPLATNEVATKVFGQGGNFTTGAANMGATFPNANTLSQPIGVALDGSNNLYVADSNNNRALAYNQPLAVPTATPTPAPTLSRTPSSAAFGAIATNNTSLPKLVVLKNLGTREVLINAVSRTGANVADFAQSNNCIGVLQPGASCTVTVTFRPTAPATTAEAATLSIWDNAAGSPQLVALSGTSSPPATLAPDPLNFGNVATGNTSVARTITLANTQSIALTGITVGFGGANPGDFSQTNTCVSPLAAFSTCTVSIKFKPAAAAARSATLIVHDSASNSPQSAALTGTGSTQVTTTASPISLGSIAVGSTTPAKAAFVINNQAVSLTVSSVTITGTNAGDFAKTTTCSTVAAFANCSVTITFKPTAVGARTATLNISDSPDSLSPHAITLNGTGTAPVTVSPTTLTFATQVHGTHSAAKLVTLTNHQNQTLVINSVSFTGTNAADFSQTNTCGIAIAALANCTVSVTFTPAAAGARSATLSISDSPDLNSPETVTISGTGS